MSGGEVVNINGSDLKHGFDMYTSQNINSYSNIRLISCYSANGANPLGQQVANAFNMETKAFKGLVYSSITPEMFNKYKMNPDFSFKHTDDTIIKLDRDGFVIYKTQPEDILNPLAWPGYKPVKFYPKT